MTIALNILNVTEIQARNEINMDQGTSLGNEKAELPFLHAKLRVDLLYNPTKY